MADYEKIFKRVEDLLPESDGFECYKFKIGLYNTAVNEHFKLPCDDDTFAILVLNTPKMFETSFKTWIQGEYEPGDSLEDLKEKVMNPIQDFMKETLQKVPDEFPDLKVETIHDFDMTPMRRPRILMCTCGHVAGAAYYFRPQLVFQNTEAIETCFPVLPEKPIIGVSLHPKYGGHFAFRAVYIFHDVKLPTDFVQLPPSSCLNSKTEIEQLLVLFNLHWRDGRFRDCGDPIERYSQLQLDFFAKPPADRWEVIRHWFPSLRPSSPPEASSSS